MLSSTTIGAVLCAVFKPQMEPSPQSFARLLDQLETLGTRPVVEPDRSSDREIRRELEEVLPSLRAFGRSLTRNYEEADDLVQAAMLKAWAARTSFRAGTSFRSWIYTILKNHFLSGKRRARFEGDWDELVASRMLAAPAVQEHGLHLSDVMRALENVGSVQREALMLTTVGEMSHIEAAAVMGVEVGTIKSRVFRARESLNRALSGDASATQVIYIGALPFGQRPSRQGGTTGA